MIPEAQFLSPRSRTVLWTILAVGVVGCSGNPSEGEPLGNGQMENFDALLAEANDFDLCDGTFKLIGDRYHHWVDASRYSPEERVVMLVWHASGIIDNGGFEYLFSGDFDGDPDFRLTAEAFKTARLMRGYQAFQDAFALFPDGKVPRDSEERYEQYAANDPDVRDEINVKFWREGWDHECERKLAQFIRENAPALRRVD